MKYKSKIKPEKNKPIKVEHELIPNVPDCFKMVNGKGQKIYGVKKGDKK